MAYFDTTANRDAAVSLRNKKEKMVFGVTIHKRNAKGKGAKKAVLRFNLNRFAFVPLPPLLLIIFPCRSVFYLVAFLL